jgi:hypothetical protein
VGSATLTPLIETEATAPVAPVDTEAAVPRFIGVLPPTVVAPDVTLETSAVLAEVWSIAGGADARALEAPSMRAANDTPASNFFEFMSTLLPVSPMAKTKDAN